MGVRYSKSCCCISGHGCTITICCSNFFYRILDILTRFFLGKIVPGVSPVVRCVQFYCFALCSSVCFQLYFDALPSQSVLVIIIIPCLRYCDACLSWCIAVGDVIPTDHCCVISYRILGYCVCDFFSICILVKIVKSILPIITCCYNLAAYFCSICQQSHCDAARTFSVLIICIIPYLLSTDTYQLRIRNSKYISAG